MLPNARRSFRLTVTLVLSIVSSYLTLASSLIVDDWDRTSVQWDGAWMGFLDQPPPTWDGTLTWGNLSGSTVTFTFTGTSVQVFGAFKPVGTWSMQSQYAIDGGEPTTFLPPQAVQVEAYNQTFYGSGTLPAGEHTLKITNLGVELWLDYFLVDDDGGDSVGASSGIARNRASATTTTTTTTAPPAKTTTPSSSIRTTHKGTSSSTINDAIVATTSTSSTSKLSTLSPLDASVSTTNTSLISTAPPSATMTPPLSSPLPPPSSSSTSSSNVTTPSRGPVASQAHATGMSRKAVIGLIAGIAAFAVLTILLVFWCWCRRRRQSRPGSGGAPYPFSSSTPSGQDMLLHPDASTDAASTSFRDSQYSATLRTDPGPRLSRPASSLTDLVESYADRESRMTHRRSMDGGVTLAGGPGSGVYGGGDAPSISEAQSIKSRLPPVYQAYAGGA